MFKSISRRDRHVERNIFLANLSSPIQSHVVIEVVYRREGKGDLVTKSYKIQEVTSDTSVT